MLKVLHTLPALDGGGAERVVFNYVSRMIDDFHFDFIVHDSQKGILEDKLISLGCKIFRVPPFHQNRKKYRQRINDILKTGCYDVIHVSQGYKGLFFLKYAKKNKIKIRIAHSHMAFIPENLINRIIRKICTLLTFKYSTHLFACSEDAAKWMWGKKAYNNGKVYIMRNAIETKKFVFNLQERDANRRKLGLSNNTFVIGNIARFSYQKNHEFLLKVFNEILKKRPDSKLVLIGGGELKKNIEKQASNLGIGNKIAYLGVVDDPSVFYNCFDLFLLPSRFEGLGIVLIEAQINGLRCVSSTFVPKSVNVTGNVSFLDLSLGESEWANYILTLDCKRANNSLVLNDYDLCKNVNDLKDFYNEAFAHEISNIQ